MIKMPQRQTLIKQTATALREGISTSTWKDFLPSERELCRQLQVSRPTLRTALGIIQREGLVAVSHGKRSQILKRKKQKIVAPKESIALVSKLPLYSMSRNRIFLIDYMSRVLIERGLSVEIVSHPGFGTNRPARAIQQLKERGNFKAFVLLMSSQAVQEWFRDNALPAIALGSVFPGIAIPSVDTDYKSMGHHAAGVFMAKGHRKVAWVIPEANHAGDLETEQTFLKGLQSTSHEAAQCRVVRHAPNSEDLIQKISPLLEGPDPTTAFFVVNAFATTSLVTHLLSRKLNVPNDVSVITRDYEQILDWITPQIAHYEPPLRRVASRISRLVVDIATSGTLPLSHTRIIPQFRAASSIGICPKGGQPG